ncbi:hypothetical protein HPB50_023986 [Hyalomma asiaticum]|uniref:Uncharacterized protein n=1 Tax=Hyalomma asiaticum TaxID=266040 RepID=A0ACB7S529_HYAAI|nr:hypothetical protein HPB50_023986 [Hyalomma asiaticum]
MQGGRLRPEQKTSLYRGVFLPGVMYASPVWWDRTRPDCRLRSRLASIQRAAMLGILGAYHTTRTAALQVLLNAPPIELELERANAQYDLVVQRTPVSFGDISFTPDEIMPPVDVWQEHPAARMYYGYRRLTRDGARRLACAPGLHVYTDGSYSDRAAGAAFVVLGPGDRVAATGRYRVERATKYIGYATKIVRQGCHLRFNYKCLNSNVVPKSLHCRPLVDTPYGRKLARDFSRGSLTARIQENKQQIIQARRKVYASEAYLRMKLRAADFSEVLEARARAETLEREKCTHAHDKKLSVLLPSLPQRHTEATSIQNLSRKQLSRDHVSVLSRGMNFAVAPRVIPKRDIIVETEECFRHMKDTAAVALARSRIVNILANSRTPRSNLTSSERAALEDLRSDPSVVVLEADKGKGIVVMDRKDYEGKMQEILDDPLHFEKMQHDPTLSTERQLVDYLRRLKTKGMVDQSLYRRLFSSDGATPRAYGLPKVHKDGCPL